MKCLLLQRTLYSDQKKSSSSYKCCHVSYSHWLSFILYSMWKQHSGGTSGDAIDRHLWYSHRFSYRAYPNLGKQSHILLGGGGHSLLYFAYMCAQELFIGELFTLQTNIINNGILEVNACIQLHHVNNYNVLGESFKVPCFTFIVFFDFTPICFFLKAQMLSIFPLQCILFLTPHFPSRDVGRDH